MEYLTKNHSKYLLQYHIIFVVKYRLKIIDQFPIKDICSQLSINDNYIIKVMEVDKDHIHLLVQAEPKISPLYIVKKLKGKSTIILWKNYSQILTRYFWKEHTFWSDGYFVSTIGNVSEQTLQKYINEQG
jgi:putative transposase